MLTSPSAPATTTTSVVSPPPPRHHHHHHHHTAYYFCATCAAPFLSLTDFLVGHHLHHLGLTHEEALFFLPGHLLSRVEERKAAFDDGVGGGSAEGYLTSSSSSPAPRRQGMEHEEEEDAWVGRERARLSHAVQEAEAQMVKAQASLLLAHEAAAAHDRLSQRVLLVRAEAQHRQRLSQLAKYHFDLMVIQHSSAVLRVVKENLEMKVEGEGSDQGMQEATQQQQQQLTTTAGAMSSTPSAAAVAEPPPVDLMVPTRSSTSGRRIGFDEVLRTRWVGDMEQLHQLERMVEAEVARCQTALAS